LAFFFLQVMLQEEVNSAEKWSTGIYYIIYYLLSIMQVQLQEEVIAEKKVRGREALFLFIYFLFCLQVQLQEEVNAAEKEVRDREAALAVAQVSLNRALIVPYQSLNRALIEP
jgi:hypothetical protein